MRVDDPSPHPGIKCDHCEKLLNDIDVSIMRFKCTECEDFDLCEFCYVNEEKGIEVHGDGKHIFIGLGRKSTAPHVVAYLAKWEAARAPRLQRHGFVFPQPAASKPSTSPEPAFPGNVKRPNTPSDAALRMEFDRHMAGRAMTQAVCGFCQAPNSATCGCAFRRWRDRRGGQLFSGAGPQT